MPALLEMLREVGTIETMLRGISETGPSHGSIPPASEEEILELEEITKE
jgi:hypothetical protein